MDVNDAWIFWQTTDEKEGLKALVAVLKTVEPQEFPISEAVYRDFHITAGQTRAQFRGEDIGVTKISIKQRFATGI